MRLTHKLIENTMKLFFTTILVQLFFIAYLSCSGHFSPFEVTGLLEYCAAACTVTVGGGLFMEYILKQEEK